jgi:hypothetical protein
LLKVHGRSDLRRRVATASSHRNEVIMRQPIRFMVAAALVIGGLAIGCDNQSSSPGTQGGSGTGTETSGASGTRTGGTTPPATEPSTPAGSLPPTTTPSGASGAATPPPAATPGVAAPAEPAR